MIHNAFLSIASVAAILASVALLVVLSALTLAPPFNRFGRHSTVAFLVCLLAIWARAVLSIFLFRHTIV